VVEAVPGSVDVLLVEDDQTVAAMYRVRLELDGLRVVHAADGETGLRLALELAPRVLLLDHRLPRLDGPGVLRALRADDRTRSLPVVVLSAYDEPEMVRAGMEMGVLEWLVKSRVTPSELAALIRRLVPGRLSLS
jgi:DNA-binding response OmpR family regulator